MFTPTFEKSFLVIKNEQIVKVVKIRHAYLRDNLFDADSGWEGHFKCTCVPMPLSVCKEHVASLPEFTSYQLQNYGRLLLYALKLFD